MPDHRTQPKDRQPDSFDQDLHPDTNAGINHAQLGRNPEQDAPAGIEIKELHNIVPELTDEELRRVVVLQPGDRLEQGATYIDLRAPNRREFTADAHMEAGRNNLFIPKSNVDYVVWNKLIGVQNQERLDQANER